MHIFDRTSVCCPPDELSPSQRRWPLRIIARSLTSRLYLIQCMYSLYQPPGSYIRLPRKPGLHLLDGNAPNLGPCGSRPGYHGILYTGPPCSRKSAFPPTARFFKGVNISTDYPRAAEETTATATTGTT